MMVIRIRAALTARHNVLAAIGVMVVLGVAVALAHGAPGQDHMAGMGGTDDSHTGQSAVVTACFAVLEVGAAGGVLLAASLVVKRRSVTPRDLGTPFLSTSTARKRPVPKARAGPALLQVYRL